MHPFGSSVCKRYSWTFLKLFIHTMTRSELVNTRNEIHKWAVLHHICVKKKNSTKSSLSAYSEYLAWSLYTLYHNTPCPFSCQPLYFYLSMNAILVLEYFHVVVLVLLLSERCFHYCVFCRFAWTCICLSQRVHFQI